MALFHQSSSKRNLSRSRLVRLAVGGTGNGAGYGYTPLFDTRAGALLVRSSGEGWPSEVTMGPSRVSPTGSACGTAVKLWPWYVPPGLIFPDVPPGANEVAKVFSEFALSEKMRLPNPGSGFTIDRFIALAEVSARDMSLGRLVEGHVDALAILAEAGRQPPPAAVLGVWAARRHGSDVSAVRQGDDWRLRGRKPWASGAGTLSHALVTATGPDGDCLFEVPMDGGGVTVVSGSWPAVGMAYSDSSDVEFDVVVAPDGLVGAPGWYVDRPGFWFGSVGVAACWLGGALGLVRALRSDLSQRGADAHQLAHLGAAMARCTSMARDIAWGASRIDTALSNPDGTMRRVALEVRHLVEDGCLEVLTHVGRAGGADPLCHDRAQARRAADLPVYIRQHHAERDDEALGRIYLNGSADQ